MSPTKQRRPSAFQRAADGSMTLIEHIRELRTRLLKAVLAILAGTILGFVLADTVQSWITDPYCTFYVEQSGEARCQFNTGTPLDQFLLELKIALYVGLVVSAPVWLYQLWAFVAPGLHKRERRYTYAFAAVATPLFVLGFWLGYLLISRSLQFFLGLNPGLIITTNLNEYFSFVINVMLLFGAGFELPLLLLMLNLAGAVSAKRLLSWWRVAVFIFFLFAAIITPTPDPFNMTILALCMSLLYFSAVGVAFLNDARRARRTARTTVGDDELSPIDDISPIDEPTPVEPSAPADRG